jgi:hypothetical protein
MNLDNTTPTLETQSFWQTHFEQFKLSQLSKTEYARKHNLVRHQFVYQVRKFETDTNKETSAIKPDFIPITIKPPILIPDKTLPILCTLQLGDNKKLLLHNEVALKLCLESWK